MPETLPDKSNFPLNLQVHAKGKEMYPNADDSDEYSSSNISDSFEEDEPRWQEEALKSGELFYVEENEAEKMSPISKKEFAESNLAKTNNRQIYKDAMPKPVAVPKINYSKTVFVDVNAAEMYLQQNSRNLLASMLGIVVLDISSKNPSFIRFRNERIVADVLVPGGVSLLSGQVNVGDVLTEVNDIRVTLVNIENLLFKIDKPSTIKLTFDVYENLPSNLEPKPVSIELDTRIQVENLPCIVNVLTPHLSRENNTFTLSEHHNVFFMTLKVRSDTAAEFDDLLYSYPHVETTIAPSKLTQIRGLFLTLSDLFKDSFSTSVLSTTLVIADETIHCAYYQVKTEVFVLCLPSTTYSLPQVHVAAANVVCLLLFMYGDLLNAFQPENKQRLDHLFHNFLFLNGSSVINQVNSPNGTSGVHQLVLTKQLQHQANSALAELEASDFDLGTKALNFSRRLYTVRGSCLFYDGYLAINHLSKDDLKDVYLFCYNHNLLAVREKDRIGLLVVWREVFRRHKETPKNKENFTETTGRYFLLIVGLKRGLLCALLQLNGKLFPSTHTPRPDTSFVDNVKAILLNLEANQFFKRVQNCTTQPSLVNLVSSDGFLSKSASTTGKPPLSETRQTSGRFRLRFSSPLKFKSAASDSDDGRTPSKTKPEEKSFSSRVSRSLFRDRSFSSQDSADGGYSPKTTGRLRPTASNEEVDLQMSDLQIEDQTQHITLTAGSSNSLFSFVKFYDHLGIIISPTEDVLHTVGGSDTYHEIISHFRRYVLLIHQRFADKNSKADSCVEEGILFQYRPTKLQDSKKKFLQYWVVGRKMTKPQQHELYVCFHNSSPQSIVELAFKTIDFL